MTIYNFKANTIAGSELSFEQYKDKVLLIVNTASQCGFTPQYQELQELYTKYKDKGFLVLAFPCNQFGGQEPESNQKIAQFCDLTFKTSFPLFQKIDVNGKDAHPLFKYLKENAKGLLGTESIKWNFTKFLIGKDGKVIDRFAPQTKPSEIEPQIIEALQNK